MAEYTLKYTGNEINQKLTDMATMSYVDEAISNAMPEVVTSVDQMTNTNKKYVMDGYIWVYGETYVEPPNHWDKSKVTINQRYSGTPGSTVSTNGYYNSDFIPVNLSLADPLVVRISGSDATDFVVNNSDGSKLMLFNSNKEAILTTYWRSTSQSIGTTNMAHRYVPDGQDYLIKIGYTSYNMDTPTKCDVYDDIAYIRFNSYSQATTALTADDIHDIKVTFDAEGGTQTKWYNTGMLHSGSGSSSAMPDIVNSVDDMIDTKKKYILNETNTVWVYGTVTVDSEPENLFELGAVNKRLASSSIGDMNGYFYSNPIILPDGWSTKDKFEISISGVSGLTENDRIWYVNSSGSLLQAYYLRSKNESNNVTLTKNSDGSFTGDILSYYSSGVLTTISDKAKGAAGFMICLHLNDTTTAITADDVSNANINIMFGANNGPQTTTTWYDTGVQWSASSEGGASPDLIIQVNNNTSAIANLESTVRGLSNSGGKSIAVPTYWKEAVDNVVTEVKRLQDEGGADVVNFCWFSDLHYVPTSKYTQNVGNLCAYIMNQCDIPFTMFTGDTVTASGLPTEQTMLDHIAAAGDMLSVIGSENLLWMRGNHDDVWGTYNNGSTTVHFVNKTSKQKLFNVMHREQAKDFRRVYGDHGTYFYIDNTPQKVRFICLNSQFYDGGDIAATTGQMTSGFGTEQLDWLEHHALQVDDDWSVVIGFHIPPTAKSINGNTYYLSQLSDGNDFRNLINKTAVDIIGIFCGHCHADAIVADDLPCPIVTITSAVNTPYDAEYSTRVQGTDTETVLDVVSVNKSERKIYCTRLGYGSDRSTSY